MLLNDKDQKFIKGYIRFLPAHEDYDQGNKGDIYVETNSTDSALHDH